MRASLAAVYNPFLPHKQRLYQHRACGYGGDCAYNIRMLWILFTLLLTAALAYFSYRSAQVLPYLPPDTNVLLSLPDVVARLVVVLVCIGLGVWSGAGAARLGWVWSNAPLDIALGAGIGLVAHLALYPATLWAARVLGERAYSPLILRHILPRTRRQWLLVPLAFVVAVLLEELLFRSLLVGALSLVAPALLLAVLGAVVFGAMHLPQGWLGAVVSGVVGLGLSLLFLASGSLLVPFAAHYAFNLAQIVRAARNPPELTNVSATQSSS